MAKYRITSPEGASFEITAPDDATPEQVHAFAQQQFSQMKAGPTGNAREGGIWGGIKQGLRDPIDAGAQLLTHALPEGVVRAGNRLNNALADMGLPLGRLDGPDAPTLVGMITGQQASAASPLDAAIRKQNAQYEADRAAAGRDGFDAARLAGGMASPTNLVLPGSSLIQGAVTPLRLAGAGALMGAGSAALQPVTNTDEAFWSQKAKQAGTGAVAGALLTPAVAKGTEAIGNAVARLTQRQPKLVGGLNRSDLNAAVEKVLQSQGMRMQDAPKVILDSVSRQVEDALRTGKQLSPAAAIRAAEAEAVGMTGDAALTAGQLTRDPIKYATERNLSGVVLNTPSGPSNPLAERFARQNQRLQELFDNAGASGAVDRNQAGQTILDALRRSDQPAKAGVDAAYESARAMNSGRAAPLDRGFFNQQANQALEQGQWGRFLPGEIRGLMNDIGRGRTPFDVDAAVQIDSILSAAQRQAGKGTPQASAIGVVRESLRNTPFMATEFADGGAGQAARQAFEEARKAAAQRFATIEQTPALKAALEGEAPDNFVRQFIIGADARDLEAMRKVLANSPEALGQARAQVANFLKKAAFGENMAGDKTFAAERYARTLDSIGPERLKALFKPEEIVRFNLAGKAAANINSVPAGATNAVNYSNTGSALFNLLQRITDLPAVRRIPFANSAANSIGQAAKARAIDNALQPAQAATAPAAELSPEARRALQRLFAPAAIAGGMAAGSGF